MNDNKKISFLIETKIDVVSLQKTIEEIKQKFEKLNLSHFNPLKDNVLDYILKGASKQLSTDTKSLLLNKRLQGVLREITDTKKQSLDFSDKELSRIAEELQLFQKLAQTQKTLAKTTPLNFSSNTENILRDLKIASRDIRDTYFKDFRTSRFDGPRNFNRDVVTNEIRSGATEAHFLGVGFEAEDILNQNIEKTSKIGQNIAEWNKQYRLFLAHNSNAVNSFWSVWSISWAIRGTLQDIFGYSNKWVAEVNKLTRAVQSGLYLYAGTERILRGISTKILQNNAHYQESIRLQMQSLDIQRKIYAVRAGINAETGKQMLLTEEQKKAMIEELQTEYQTLRAKMMGERALAEEETLNVRSGLIGIGSKVASYAAVAMAIIGIIRWLQNYNEQVNESIRSMKRLREELASLGETSSTVKVEFSDLNSLIDKVTSKYKEFGNVIRDINDPFERYAKTLEFIAEKSAAKERPTDFFGAAAYYIKKIASLLGEAETRSAELQAGLKPLEEGPSQEAIDKWNTLMSILNGGTTNNERLGFLNQLLTLSSKSITKQIKNVDQLNEQYKKWRKILIDTTYAELLESNAAYINARIKQIQADNTKNAAEKALEIKSIYMDLYGSVSNYYDNIKKKAKEYLETSSTTVMSIKDFYRQMYQAYSDAAKHDSQYTKLAAYWKQKYIEQLKIIINEDLKELQTLKAGTELWKQKNLELAKARQALADMLEISEKLKSTWWNIPTAVIRPTQSQLTSTVLLQPQFVINANTVDEIKEAVGKQLENYTWKMNEPTGTEGGAL